MRGGLMDESKLMGEDIMEAAGCIIFVIFLILMAVFS